MNHSAKTNHALQCMEIVGSNRAARQLVSGAGLDIWIDSQPLETGSGGGDIHYVSTCGAGYVTRLVLADVSGHGAAVDGVAQSLRRLMRKYINTLDQTRFAIALNHEFSAFAEAGRFATALILTYFAPTNHLIVCNAGHCRPLWYRAEQAAWEPLAADTVGECESLKTSKARYHFERLANLPLGILEPTDYEQFAVRLRPGDLIVLYTDGITEGADGSGRQLGEAGLLEMCRVVSVDRAISDHGAAAMGEQVGDRCRARQGQVALADDCSLIVVEHTATGPPKPSLSRSVRTLAKILGLSRV
jgi:serine phosphatase RsbU (regulator of sigma subunit)